MSNQKPKKTVALVATNVESTSKNQMIVSTVETIKTIGDIVQQFPKISETIQNAERFFESAKADLSLGYEKAKEQFDNDMKELSLQFATKKEQMEKELSAYQDTIETSRDELANSLKIKEQECKQQLDELQYQFTKQRKDLEMENNSKLQQLSLTHQDELSKMREETFAKMCEALKKENVSKEDYAKFLKELNIFRNQNNDTISSLKAEYEQKLKIETERLEEKYRNENLIKEAQNSARIIALQTQVDYLEKANANLTQNVSTMTSALSEGVKKGTQVVVPPTSNNGK